MFTPLPLLRSAIVRIRISAALEEERIVSDVEFPSTHTSSNWRRTAIR